MSGTQTPHQKSEGVSTMTTRLESRALAAMPGGVNSPVRAFSSVGGRPLFARRGKGAYLETVDGRNFIDYCMSFGPLILGHAHEDVVRAVQESAAAGTSYAMTTPAEIELAELIQSAIPSMERIRLVSSGTEACMTAIRLARGVTGRTKLLKFSGCYHGHADSLLVQAGSGVTGMAKASSAGVTPACASQTIVARYNHMEDVNSIVKEHGDDLAGVILEPVAGNMGLVQPQAAFLEELTKRIRGCGALVIFDEVMTGFRLTFGGYQSLCGITPDLTTLGKTIGGGMPIGAVGGRKHLMDQLAPLGPVYQAGTLSGNPVSVAAGLATLRRLQTSQPYAQLDSATEYLANRILESARKKGRPLMVSRIGSMFSLFFCEALPRDFDEVIATETDAFPPFFHRLLEHNVYVPPSAFETSFVSTEHDSDVLERTAAAFDKALGS